MSKKAQRDKLTVVDARPPRWKVAQEGAMKETAIVTDTNSLMTRELAKEYNVRLVPLYVTIAGKSYPENEVNLAEFYRDLPKWKQENRLPTTDAPNVADFQRAFRELGRKAKGIVYVGYSSKLGIAVSSAAQAKTRLKEESIETEVEVIDTHTGCGAQMLITLEAARAASAGQRLPQVIEVCKKIRDRVSFIFLADNLYYLAKGGRIHRARPWAASTISNTVLLEMDMSTGGQNTPVARCRTKGQALKTLFDLVKQRAGNKVIHVAIDHADAPAEAEELKDKVSSKFKCAEVYVNQMQPVLTTHTGVGSRIVSWWSED